MPLEVITLPSLVDNYFFLARCQMTGDVAAFDVPSGPDLQNALDARGWRLSKLFLTHHHWDHVDGLADFDRSGVEVIGAAADAHRLPPLDTEIAPGAQITIGQNTGTVWDVSGHSIGHVAYVFEGHVFTGDSLMVLGCGRLFEGTPAQMYRSLQQFTKLGGETVIYSCHEYAETNLRFAQSLDPDNEALRVRGAEIRIKRAAGRPTVPSTVALERATNPFLRCDDPKIRQHLDMIGAADHEVFTKIRKMRDGFQ